MTRAAVSAAHGRQMGGSTTPALPVGGGGVNHRACHDGLAVGVRFGRGGEEVRKQMGRDKRHRVHTYYNTVKVMQCAERVELSETCCAGLFGLLHLHRPQCSATSNHQGLAGWTGGDAKMLGRCKNRGCGTQPTRHHPPATAAAAPHTCATGSVWQPAASAGGWSQWHPRPRPEPTASCSPAPSTAAAASSSTSAAVGRRCRARSVLAGWRRPAVPGCWARPLPRLQLSCCRRRQ